MATFTMSRRTGALLAGVVPPSGTPLPQQTLGIGTWVGSPDELAAPALRSELLRLSKIRKELRAGHLRNAARLALEVRVDNLPPDMGTRRSVAVLQSVGAAYIQPTNRRSDEVLRSCLALLGSTIPPLLLDHLLAPESLLHPDLVESVCLQHDESRSTMERLRVLLLRRTAHDYRANPDQDRLGCIHQRVREVLAISMHEKLHRWADAVGKEAGRKDLTALIDVIGHNLALTDPKNKELHRSLTLCFEWKPIDLATQRSLARLSFSAWSTLRDVIDGNAEAELVSFSAQAAAFRQVFEVLLQRGVLQRFIQADNLTDRHGLIKAVEGGKATLGLGRWFGLLFASSRQPDPLAKAMRNWFYLDRNITDLSGQDTLRNSLGSLLEVRLDALPHDEESARATASDMLDAVLRAGFGVTSPGAMPKKGHGLVGRLCKAAI